MPGDLSIVIPTLDAADGLRGLLPVLADDGMVREIVVADGGSSDDTVAVARAAGCVVYEGERGRGRQLADGAISATGDWLLFLHADTVPETGWRDAVDAFMSNPANEMRAGYFRYTLDDAGAAARVLERVVAWRNRLLALPYGDQGLLISRRFYDALGGFRPLPLMEDVDMARRIGRRRLVRLVCAAHTSAERYRRHGYLPRMARNLFCLALYFLGVPPGAIRRVYG